MIALLPSPDAETSEWSTHVGVEIDFVGAGEEERRGEGLKS